MAGGPLFLIRRKWGFTAKEAQALLRPLVTLGGFWLGYWVFETAGVIQNISLAGTTGAALGACCFGSWSAMSWFAQKYFSKQAKSMEVDGATKMFESL